jgi:hypothetical protein
MNTIPYFIALIIRLFHTVATKEEKRERTENKEEDNCKGNRFIKDRIEERIFKRICTTTYSFFCISYINTSTYVTVRIYRPID